MITMETETLKLLGGYQFSSDLLFCNCSISRDCDARDDRIQVFSVTVLALSLSDVVFILLINVKLPTIVGILTFMSRINFVHS